MDKEEKQQFDLAVLKMRAHADNVVKNFQQSMMRVDDLSNVSKNIVDSLKVVSSSVDSIRSDYKHLVDEFQQSLVKSAELHRIAKDQASRNSLDIGTLNLSLEAIKNAQKDSVSALSVISTVMRSLNSEKDSNAKKNDVELVKKIVICAKEDFQEKLDQVQLVHVALKNKDEDLSKKYDTSLSTSKEYAQKIQKNEHDLSKFKENLSSLESRFSSELAGLQGSFEKKLSEKLESIPKPVIPSLDDAKKQMKLVVEPALLDAKNANLRSVNNESRIIMLEKKIENLQLMLQNLNLQSKG